MLKWVQSGISAVTGTAEPEYGPDAIHPVTKNLPSGSKAYRETTAEDFAWKAPAYTNVETQTFYFTCLKTGYVGLAQIIHSNVIGIHTTAQFTFKIYNKNKPEDMVWTSTKLEDFTIKGSNFYATNLSVELIENDKYVIKSQVSPDSIVDLTLTKLVPGVIFGKDGTTYYGDDIENPWGSMRHLFWPRCTSTGTIKLKNESIEIEGISMFVMALQGMKPHHAAASWNFCNFQSENYSAIHMEFTTPKSYDTTTVAIGIVASNDKILVGSINNKAIHHDSKIDEVGWPVPQSITFNFKNETEKIDVSVNGPLTNLIERVDVMAEIPQFVKSIVSGVAGTKPYIYQYCNDMDIVINESGKEKIVEKGVVFNEVTFIC